MDIGECSSADYTNGFLMSRRRGLAVRLTRGCEARWIGPQVQDLIAANRLDRVVVVPDVVDQLLVVARVSPVRLPEGVPDDVAHRQRDDPLERLVLLGGR